MTSVRTSARSRRRDPAPSHGTVTRAGCGRWNCPAGSDGEVA